MIIRHKNAMDVAFLVLSGHDFKAYPGGYSRYSGTWINMGFVKSFSLNIYQVININDEDKKDWLICNSPDDECVRSSEWECLK